MSEETAMDPHPHDRLLRPTEAAEFLNVSPRTLERRRAEGLGPPWVRVGHAVRYERPALTDFIAKQRRGVQPDPRLAP
jgi:hypothetical protein